MIIWQEENENTVYTEIPSPSRQILDIRHDISLEKTVSQEVNHAAASNLQLEPPFFVCMCFHTCAKEKLANQPLPWFSQP